MNPKRVLIGVSGASGALYTKKLLEALAREKNREVLAVASHAGRRVFQEELGLQWPVGEEGAEEFAASLGFDSLAGPGGLRILPVDDIGASPASGSYHLDAMAIVPCSMRTLGAVAGGLADNLLTRAADVCMKEHRRLVLVPRECPFSAIHLENMLRLARIGVRIVPPAPGFYQRPETLDDLVDFVVEKILQQMGVGDFS